jgi:hypothetical protein
VRRLLLLVTVLALGIAAPAHAASLQVGLGINPGIALDDAGNAVVGWQTGQNYDVQVCVLPPRARACEAVANVAFPGSGYGKSRVSVLMPAPNTIDVVVPRTNLPGSATFLARSTDGGRSFGPAAQIAETDFGGAVLTADGRVALVGSSTFLTAAVVHPNGADRNAQGASMGENLDGLFNDITGNGAEVFAAGSYSTGTQVFRLPGGGDPNNPGAWQRLPDLPAGRQPELTGGPAGVVALLEPIGQTPRGLFAQRFVGPGWTPPVTINSYGLNNDFKLAQNSTGRLTAVWTEGTPYPLNYMTSVDGGLLWSSQATVTLFGGFPSDLEVATASSGVGVAVVGQSFGNNEPIRVARFTPRTAPLAQRRIGSATVQARALCSSTGHFAVVVEASRAGARISPGAVLRRATFGRARGARRIYAQRFRAGYEPTRTSVRVPVRLRPRSGRSRTLTLRARRCNAPG